MSTNPTRLPPVVTPIADPQTGLPTLEQLIWQQELLLSRSAWIPYTPTVAHISALTVNDCAFVQLGKLVAFRVGLAGTSDGNRGTFTLPFMAKSINQTFATALETVGAGVSFIGSDNLTVTVEKYDGTAPALNAAVQWIVSGVYEVQ